MKRQPVYIRHEELTKKVFETVTAGKKVYLMSDLGIGYFPAIIRDEKIMDIDNVRLADIDGVIYAVCNE